MCASTENICYLEYWCQEHRQSCEEEDHQSCHSLFPASKHMFGLGLQQAATPAIPNHLNRKQIYGRQKLDLPPPPPAQKYSDSKREDKRSFKKNCTYVWMPHKHACTNTWFPETLVAPLEHKPCSPPSGYPYGPKKWRWLTHTRASPWQRWESSEEKHRKSPGEILPLSATRQHYQCWTWGQVLLLVFLVQAFNLWPSFSISCYSFPWIALQFQDKLALPSKGI